jgi:hypothetical protein
MLLNIYDTKEVFVKELQTILAERLLASKDYDVERETRNIEMIKTRFGEANIQSCDVMLKDIIESKRVDRLIHNRAENVTPRPPRNSRLFALFLDVDERSLCIHAFSPGFSGRLYGKKLFGCQPYYSTNSPNTKVNTRKSNEDASWSG